jgi:hypothetical protein
MNVRFQYVPDLHREIPNGRVLGNSGHPSKSLRYFLGRTGIHPEFAVPCPGLYDGNAAKPDTQHTWKRSRKAAD